MYDSDILEVIIPEQHYQGWSEKNQEFIYVNVKETKLQLKHSLISLKKWEQKWHKPFLGNKEKTTEEICDYIRCMTIGQVPDPKIYRYIPAEIIKRVVDYIEDPMTATWFSGNGTVGAAKSSKEIITNEIIYYWMISLGIPVEFQKWHLNALLTLIKVVNIKNSPKKKMSRKEELQRRTALNNARRAQYNTKG